MSKPRPRIRRVAGAAVVAVSVLLAALVLGACGGSSDGSGSSSELSLVAYSTPQTVYEEDLVPGFQATPEGKDIDVSTSFGSSGDQSRAVEGGLKADVVHLPIEPDITKLVDAGLVSADYKSGPHKGILQQSVVTFITRPGNPKNIKDWDDLVRDDVDVLTPNPFTSGSARWNIVAAYGQAVNNGASEQEALDFVKKVLENTVVQDASARDALQTFLGGQGDVLLGYENEAIGAKEAGEEVDYTTPDDTIRIDTIGVVTKDASPKAQAFLDFLQSDEGQTLFAENGYRPVVQSVLDKFKDEFPIPPGLFTIADFGGWDKVADDFFDPDKGKVAAIERDLGVQTEG